MINCLRRSVHIMFIIIQPCVDASVFILFLYLFIQVVSLICQYEVADGLVEIHQQPHTIHLFHFGFSQHCFSLCLSLALSQHTQTQCCCLENYIFLKAFGCCCSTSLASPMEPAGMGSVQHSREAVKGGNEGKSWAVTQCLSSCSV